MATDTQALHKSDRADILDALRGFAVLGILVANSSNFCGYNFLDDSQKELLFTHSTDGALKFLLTTFVQGKFYSLFSLLFGIGFSIFLLRDPQNRGLSVKHFYRRLMVLLAIGLVHAFVLWEGDILVLYALLGFLLPIFKSVSNRNLLIIAGVLLVSPVVIDGFKIVYDFSPGAPLQKFGAAIDQSLSIPADSSAVYYLFTDTAGFDEVLKWNFGGFFYRYAYLLNSNRIPKVLAMFIVGLYTGRNMLYTDLLARKAFLLNVSRWGFLIGIPFSVAMAYLQTDPDYMQKNINILLSAICYSLGVVPLSLAYASSFAIAWGGWWRRKLILLAPVGRMALTNYLMQSVIGISVYYNVGLGLGAKFGPTLFIPIALSIFVLQIIYSGWWFRHFNFGPVEWIWRQFTYGKKLPLKKRLVVENEGIVGSLR